MKCVYLCVHTHTLQSYTASGHCSHLRHVRIISSTADGAKEVKD